MATRALGAGLGAMTLAAAVLAGCGGSSAPVAGLSSRTSEPITEARAVMYAHAVSLRADDLPGFVGSGAETKAPAPGPNAVKLNRCLGGADRARRIANVNSREFSAGRRFSAEFARSRVEVWATPALAGYDSAAAHTSRGRACFVSFLEAVRRRNNREREGRGEGGLRGPFTVTVVPNPLPGVSQSYLTVIDETRLLRGAIFFHIYRDLFEIVSGAAELELEIVGFGHRVPARTEARALRALLERATAAKGLI